MPPSGAVRRRMWLGGGSDSVAWCTACGWGMTNPVGRVKGVVLLVGDFSLFSVFSIFFRVVDSCLGSFGLGIL